jgi:hypothetical protein
MSSINPINTVAALNDKLPWEDPSMVLERDLIARAQGGPPDEPGFGTAPNLLAPLGLSPSAGGQCGLPG